MPRGLIPSIPLEVHSAILVAQQSGAGQRIIAGVPIYSSDLHRMQTGEGFWGDVWSGLKSGFQTLFKTGANILGDIINPGVDIKKTVSTRVGEATSHLLDQGVEAIRRRQRKRSAAEGQSGSGKRRRLSSLRAKMKSLQYITCPGGQKLSVLSRQRKGRKRRRSSIKKKRKTSRRKTSSKAGQGQRRRRRRKQPRTKRQQQRRAVVRKRTGSRKKRGGVRRRRRVSSATDLGF
jgi:hypothetical protein